jgi:hypothetical protein
LALGGYKGPKQNGEGAASRECDRVAISAFVENENHNRPVGKDHQLMM